MGAMIGFALGYVFGTRAGEKGWEELQASWKTITSSAEVRDLIAGGLVTARALIRQGAGVMAERLSAGPEPGLRRAA